MWKYHASIWEKACRENGITIGGEQAEFVAGYREQNNIKSDKEPRQHFSHARLLQYLRDFIVAEDQVSVHILSSSISLSLFGSLSG
jgi:hypothetical protein